MFPQKHVSSIRKLMDVWQRKYVTQCSTVQMIVSVDIQNRAFENCIEIMVSFNKKNKEKSVQMRHM